MKKTLNYLLAGVGGQGTILASDVLVNAGLAAGYQAKQAEVHGMSQRGGSVTSHVRWGEVVYSPLVAAGEVDVFLAFEKVEALRYVNQLKPGALALVNMEAIEPVTVTSGGQSYPSDETLFSVFARVTPHAVYLDGPGIARGLGNLKVANVVLLGALSALLEDQEQADPALTADVWLDVISARVPQKYLELNRQAFLLGRKACRAGQASPANA
ncbi:MAG TPA: indolepyruvate oxidoreductase subunit beta [Anaerolineaceae bacterium]|nr:indolepyruvate oxidoreductase subunit beta [Anaerolineaceae bacterium]